LGFLFINKKIAIKSSPMMTKRKICSMFPIVE